MAGSRPRFRTSPATHRWWRLHGSASDSEPALTLDVAVTALGRHPDSSCQRARTAGTVALSAVVGTVARPEDFDRSFRPRNEALRERWESLANLPADTVPLPPVSLVQVGELYFVVDGHHRVSVARARGQVAIDAHVRQVCTIAYACACLSYGNLANKAAERDFLTAVPLPDHLLRDLWLDQPQAYQTLAASARTWSDEQGLTSPDPNCVLDTATAAFWWDTEVLPGTQFRVSNARETAPSLAAAYLHTRAVDPG